MYLISGLYSAALGDDLGGNATKIAAIKKAVTDSLCYDVYWAGGWGHGEYYQRGVPLPLKLIVDGDKFYARIDPIGFVGMDRQPVRATRIGIIRGERAAVVTNYEPNVDPKFASGPLIEDTMTIPVDCVPRYDPSSPQKERMLQTVVSTLQKRLSDFVRNGVAKYQPEVTLTIADFNVDYPSTYILVEPPGEPRLGVVPAELYAVTLHNPQDYDSDKYEREGEYPFGEIRIQPHHKPLLAKIRKHGIIRKITLTP